MKPVPNITRVTIKKSKNVRLLYMRLDELAGAKGCLHLQPQFHSNGESQDLTPGFCHPLLKSWPT